MKEITRRLYTKPVMLGMAFLVGMVLLVGLFVTVKNGAAQGTIVPAGFDKFETTANGETYHNFASSKIPADFFGDGSIEYSGTVPLEGVPLPNEGDIDTIIERLQSVQVGGTTGIVMRKLSLKSINAITVNFDNGTAPQSWNVAVDLSPLQASTGTMTIEAGGTFDSTLKVWPRFTFTRNGVTLVLDTGDPNGPGLTAAPDYAVAGEFEAEPVPAPTIAPCPVVIDEFEPHSGDFASASASSCAPVTLTSNNSPWTWCGSFFCIPRPLTEAELLAAHNASPPGTKKRQLAAKTVAVGE